jgi:glucosamine-phosphate N-acetyltransferase
MSVRIIKYTDYYKGYIGLLQQLTKAEKMTYKKFKQLLDNTIAIIYVIEDIENKKIIATGTLLKEQKIIHNGGKVGHIEDIVVDNEYRGKGLGKKLLQHIINIAEKDCYKVILNCKNSVKPFYEKFKFKEHSINMAIYF